MKYLFIKILKWILKTLSQLIVLRFQPQVIAITGSVGKTSTKEAIYAVLSAKSGLINGGKKCLRVRKSKGNLNNELGIPLTIIGDWTDEELKLVSRDTPKGGKRLKKLLFWLKVIISAKMRIFFGRKDSYPEILILEYAADRPGDIEYLMDIARPQIGIITAVGEIPVHVEFFSGPEALAKEKAKLMEDLPANGFAILNFDNEIAMRMKEQTKARIISFGFGEGLPALSAQAGQAGPDLRISNFENRLTQTITDYTRTNMEKSRLESALSPHKSVFGGVSFKLEYGGSFVPVVLKNVFGRAQAYAAAIAACVGLIFDLNLVEISEALSSYYQPVRGRMNLIAGVKDTYIIDDSYNASPISMEEALRTISELPAKRKIAVLGDMLELGKYAIEAHEDIGRLAAKTVDILVTVGPRAKFIAETAKISGLPENKILSFDTSREACLAVQSLIKKGDLILIKASRAVGLDRVVEEIKKQ